MLPQRRDSARQVRARAPLPSVCTCCAALRSCSWLAVAACRALHVLASESVTGSLSDLIFANTVRVAACSHRRGARLRQVAHEALVLPRRRDSVRPSPGVCLHQLVLPRRAVVLQLAAARVVRGWCRVLACTTPRSFGSNSDSMCAKACMLVVCTIMTRVCSYCFSQPCKSPATSHPRNELV